MNLNYSIVYSERKTLSIIIERDRSIIVRAPHNTSEELIAKEVNKRKKIIQKKVEHIQKYPYKKQIKDFVSGESLMFLGENYQLEIVKENIESVIFDNKFIISQSNQTVANKLFKQWYVKTANEILIPKAQKIAKQIGVEYNNINILDLKYRWGSCTPKDNIHFNWRLIKAPVYVIEYIIAHELTHLLVANHTPEFWNRVSALLPNYENAKLWLKVNGHELETDF